MSIENPTPHDGTYTPPRHGWCCFHCGDHFPCTDKGMADAREHFGPTPDFLPECIERRTVSADDLVRRMREAERTAEQAVRDRNQAEEREEGNAGQVADAVRRLRAPSLTAAVEELQELRVRQADNDKLSIAFHARDAEAWQEAMVEVCGPGEYFPPAAPSCPSHLERLRWLIDMLEPAELARVGVFPFVMGSDEDLVERIDAAIAKQVRELADSLARFGR